MATFNIVIQTQVNQAINNIRQVGNQLSNVEKAANRLRGLIQQVFAIGGIGFGLRELINLSDTYTKLESRIRLVTNSASELRAVQTRLFEVANSTRVSYDSTVTLFTRMSSATKQLGISQAELIQIVKSVNQAVAISGATSIEAHNALIQFSQGLASARLGGEELRSVLEQLPAIADVIAKHLGVTRGALRDLAAQGKLTPQVIIEAFREAREELETRFAKVAPTIGSAFTVLNNQILDFVGNANKNTGAAKDLANAILFLADNFNTVANVLEGVLIAALIRYAVRAIPAAIAATEAFTIALLANPLAAVAVALLYIIGLLYTFSDRIIISADSMATLTDAARVLVTDIKNYFSDLFTFVDKGISNFVPKIATALVEARNQVRGLVGLKAVDNPYLNEIQDNPVPTFGTSGTTLKGRIDRAAQDRKMTEFISGLEKDQALAALSTSGTPTGTTNTPTGTTKLDTFAATIAKLQEENKALNLSKTQRELANKEIELEFRLRKALTPEQKTQYESLLAENRLLKDKADILDNLREPQEKLVSGTAALNDLMKEGKITTEEYSTKLRELSISALAASRDIGNGIQKGLLQIQEEFGNVADLASTTLVNSFKKAEDAIVEFVQTGKFSFKDLVSSIISDLTRLAVRQNVTGPLANMLGLGGGSGGGGLGDIFGGLFGGQGGIARLTQTGSSNFVGPLQQSSNPFSFLGFATGGNFIVGGNGPTDSQLVQFLATPGEMVNISTPQQRKAMNDNNASGKGRGAPIINNWNITTKDANSFRASEAQLTAQAARMITRGRRNN